MISTTDTEKNIQSLFRQRKAQEEQQQQQMNNQQIATDAMPTDMAGANTLKTEAAVGNQAIEMKDAGLGDASLSGPKLGGMQQSGVGMENNPVPVDADGEQLPTSPAARSDAQDAYNQAKGEQFGNMVQNAVGFAANKISDATTRATEIAGKVAGQAGDYIENEMGIDIPTSVDEATQMGKDYIKKETGVNLDSKKYTEPGATMPTQKEIRNTTRKRDARREERKANEAALYGTAQDLENGGALSAEEHDANIRLVWDYLSRTRGPAFLKMFMDDENGNRITAGGIQDLTEEEKEKMFLQFRSRLSEVGFENAQDIEAFVTSHGLHRATEDSADSKLKAGPTMVGQGHINGVHQYGSGYRKGDVVSNADEELGDIKRSENPVQPSELNAQNRAIQNQRERGDAGNDVTNMTPVNQNGAVQTDGKVFDPSRKGPANRTAGGAAFEALTGTLFELYEDGEAKNAEEIAEITNYMAVELGIDPLQFPEEQRDAMVKAEVMRHLAQFGDSRQRSIANMLANGENPYYVDKDGNTQVAIPTDGRDGVAPNTGRVAEKRFNPNTGMWEVGRAPERRLGDERRAAHTMLSEQMTTGNYPVERYLDSEGNWKEGGIEQFQKDNAIALGIHYDEKGNMIYDGRGARHGDLGLQKELETFRNLMQRSATFARQREMRGFMQNARSPTLGPKMYFDSLQQAGSLQEKLEIANFFGDQNMANQISQQITEEAAVRSAAAGAEKGDPTAPEVMAAQSANVQAALAQGRSGEAFNMLVTAGTPPMVAGQQIGSALVKQRGGTFTPDLLQDAGMVQFMDAVFNELGGGTTLKGSGSGYDWGIFGDDANGQARTFTDRVLQMLGAQADPEMREAIFQWWHTRNDSSQYAGHYADGQASGDNTLPTPPKQEAPPEEDLTPPKDGKQPPAKPPASPFDKKPPKKQPPKKAPPKKDPAKPGTRARGRRPFDPK